MSTKILVVDDEPDLEQLIRQKFRRSIRDNELVFLFARNGVDAVATLAAEPDVELVLTDINMPEMDGLTLLGKIDELNAAALKSVVVSAYGDLPNIRVAMNRGAFDFVTKPIDLGDLETTIQKALRESALIKEALRTRDELIALQRDLDVATDIQMSMLPRTLPSVADREGVDIYATMLPAKEVGGDLYDFFRVDENRIGFVVGDVSGKGVPAALLMGISRTLLRSAGRSGVAPDECLATVNRVLSEEILPNMFVTVFYGVIDTLTGEMAYSSAGHNPPYLLTGDGRVTALNGVGGPPIGVVGNAPYQQERVTLGPKDAVLLFTDGVTEAMDLNDEFFGEKRLEELLSDSHALASESLVRRTIEAVQAFSKGAPQADDITCLALRFLGRGRPLE
ncbi:MAG TPA: SpoIIE family protein phosphatase [Candidatus Krumholzibacteria bacterium]|nr:SpoIIE family protein phosphatase [Candidatus Krumholzibacteria bacterium]